MASRSSVGAVVVALGMVVGGCAGRGGGVGAGTGGTHASGGATGSGAGGGATGNGGGGGGGSSGAGGILNPPISCTGTSLQGDPSGRPTCPPPPPPTQGCDTLQSSIGRVALTPTPAHDAEMRIAFDPRQGSNLAYIATTESTVQTGGTGPTDSCITSKRIVVQVSQDQGATWSVMPGSDSLPQGQWATDPDVSVGVDGTVYVTLLLTNSYPNCGVSPNFIRFDVQVWTAPPNGTLQPAFAGGSPFVGGLLNPAIVDIPQIAASPTIAGQVVVAFDDTEAQVVTYQRNASGTYDEQFRFGAANSFPSLAMDSNGDLYIGTLDPRVQRFTWNGTSWTLAADGFPPVMGTSVIPTPFTLPSSANANLDPDPNLGITVTRIGGASDPVVYVAFDVTVGGQRQIELVAANSTSLNGSAWTTPVLIPRPSGSLGSFHPRLSSDANNDIVDLIDSDLEGTSGGPLSALNVSTYFYRLDAAQRSVILGPTLLNSAVVPVSALPTRHSDQPASLFIGEYTGIATKGLTAIAAFPDYNASTANVDLGRAQITQTCNEALTLVDPDNTWECSCHCSADEFVFVPTVGCASSSATTIAAACAQVCQGVVCGGALACGFGACQASTAGHMISAQSCAVSDGKPAGAPPASTADFVATSDSASSTTVHVAGQTTTTSLPGSAFMNVSTSPPTAGATAEISRLNLTPPDLFIGGAVNATVRNIALVHRARIRGTFTDATHFSVAPGTAEMVMTVQTQASEGGLSSPLNVRASNPSPVTGTLDLAHNTLALDGTLADGAGNSIDIHFHGSITSRPPDSNGNGIIDAVDKCPGEAFGPDRVPPVFTFVPPDVTTSSCSGVALGTALATDPCGVTITNNAPAKYPLGTTTVTWTARDGAGNTAIAVQQVTAVLGDDASCCPTGTNVILGTSNNDTITGTAGADCILALGGQDTINGGGGDDYISGGDGDDVINGQDGNDHLYGGSGQDIISGGLGNDFIDGGDGDDQLNGDDGDDTINGGLGQNIINGGTGNDFLSGGAGDDQIFGGDGNDVLVGGAGNDHLYGQNGNDALFGQDGDDTLDGGTGVNQLDGGLGHNSCVDNGVVVLVCTGEGH